MRGRLSQEKAKMLRRTSLLNFCSCCRVRCAATSALNSDVSFLARSWTDVCIWSSSKCNERSNPASFCNLLIRIRRSSIPAWSSATCCIFWSLLALRISVRRFRCSFSPSNMWSRQVSREMLSRTGAEGTNSSFRCWSSLSELPRFRFELFIQDAWALGMSSRILLIKLWACSRVSMSMVFCLSGRGADPTVPSNVTNRAAKGGEREGGWEREMRDDKRCVRLWRTAHTHGLNSYMCLHHDWTAW